MAGEARGDPGPFLCAWLRQLLRPPFPRWFFFSSLILKKGGTKEKELSLTIIHNDQGEEGYLLTQDDMRQLLKDFRREAQLSFEALGKLCDIDPEILQDYEEGIYNLRPEAYRLILHVYGLLFDDFKVKN